jgi:hypothetical protein
MSQVLNIPTPNNGPAASQLVIGSGTLTSVANTMPPGAGAGPGVGLNLASPLQISFYDSSSGSLANPGTLICSVNSPSGSATMSAAYTHGLFCIQQSPSSATCTC